MGINNSGLFYDFAKLGAMLTNGAYSLADLRAKASNLDAVGFKKNNHNRYADTFVPVNKGMVLDE